MTTAAHRVSSTSDPFEELRAHGTATILAGIVSVLAGICALAYPGITLRALAIFTGINLLVVSAVRLVDAFSEGLDTTTRMLSGVLGILGLVAGMVVLRRPGETLLALVLFVVAGWRTRRGAPARS